MTIVKYVNRRVRYFELCFNKITQTVWWRIGCKETHQLDSIYVVTI